MDQLPPHVIALPQAEERRLASEVRGRRARLKEMEEAAISVRTSFAEVSRLHAQIWDTLSRHAALPTPEQRKAEEAECPF